VDGAKQYVFFIPELSVYIPCSENIGSSEILVKINNQDLK
jgi:hypothetical protein